MAIFNCVLCEDQGAFCEDHPDLPMGHGCGCGVGIPCWDCPEKEETKAYMN